MFSAIAAPKHPIHRQARALRPPRSSVSVNSRERPSQAARSGDHHKIYKLSIPINSGLLLEAAALLAFAVLVGIFVHSIIPLLAAD